VKRTTCACILAVFLLLPACGPEEAPEVEDPSWAHVAPEQIAEAKKHGVPVAFENDLGMRFVLIPAGTFPMGSPEDEEGRGDDETQHEVTISRPFYMQITEMTNEQYAHQVGTERWQQWSEGWRNLPVQNVSWEHTTSCARWLSREDGMRGYRLPTEEEWEYACRAGTSTPFSTGATISTAEANFGHPRDLPRQPPITPPARPVGSFAPNPWGLHDMHGNVREWCLNLSPPLDVYAENVSGGLAYSAIRGGFWLSPAQGVRSACRGVLEVDLYDPTLGFRLVSPLPEAGE